MFDRRQFLLAGVALAGCATHAAPPTEGLPDPAREAELRALAERLAQRSRTSRLFLLQRFDTARLTGDGRALYAGLLPGAEAELALSRFAYGEFGVPYAVTHRNGAYRRAAEMREEDAPRRVANIVAAETAQLEAEARRGVLAPAFVFAPTIAAVEAARDRILAAGDGAHAETIAALNRQAETLRQLASEASADAGVWKLPDGDAYFRQTLKLALGAEMDPHTAHETALARCHALQAEADTLLRGLGLREGDVASRLRTLARDPRYLFSDDDAGKARTVALMQDQLARMRTLLPRAFDGADALPAEVRRLPDAQEANGTAGSRRGAAYLVDLGRPRPSWTLGSVVHHELLPGHILQAPFERNAAPPALQTRYASGYSEGWAIYAEQLADELGAFDDDPAARLGYLQWMLFRLARVVVDTGIHALRWDKPRAIAEARALQGESIAFISIEDDIDRYCVQPGFYAAQGLAALHLADLRERTRRAAHGRFTLARFHNAVLRLGPLAPPGLEIAAHNAFASA